MIGTFRDYDDYIIYDDGRIYSLRRNKFLTNKIMKDGYCRLQLYKNGKCKMYNVHRIVAEVFIPNQYNKPFVNHIDGNKQNNHVKNLEWVTQKENIDHAFRTGLSTYQLKNTGSLCVPIIQFKDGKIIQKFPSIIEAHRQLGYSRSSISKCCRHMKNYKTAYGYIWEFDTTSND